MQKLTVIELLPRGSMLMNVESVNENKNTRTLQLLKQKMVGCPRKKIGRWWRKTYWPRPWRKRIKLDSWASWKHAETFKEIYHEKDIYMRKVLEKTFVRKEHFVASQIWLEKFMKRNCLSLRRRTTTAQKNPSHIINKIIAYLRKARRLSDKFKYNLPSIIVMVETAVSVRKNICLSEDKSRWNKTQILYSIWRSNTWKRSIK